MLPELGAYIQSFLRPTKPLLPTLHGRLPEEKFKRICKRQIEAEFIQYYNHYESYPLHADVILQTMAYTVRIRHVQLPDTTLDELKRDPSVDGYIQIVSKYSLWHHIKCSMNPEYVRLNTF